MEIPKEQFRLFDFPPPSKRKEYFKQLSHPFWTENKAKLIAKYLYYFVLVTKHGAYIDGFAGPQKPNKPETWAAKLVIENDEPRWLRHFYLFEKDTNQYEQIKSLKNSQPLNFQRKIHIYHDDFNYVIQGFLGKRPIGEREATFCLLDQRTFECHWSTVEALASYKREGMKIEFFYFLSAGWFDRAMSLIKDNTVLAAWWGRGDWQMLRGIRASRRADIFCDRIKDEFKYEFVTPWPIYDRKDGSRIMYHMIHATDHPLAPNLMSRAYRKAVQPREPIERVQLEFEQWKSGR